MVRRKVLEDDYYWLRDDARKQEELLAHLRAENTYAEGMTAHLSGARKRLYEELRSHIKETDSSAGRLDILHAHRGGLGLHHSLPQAAWIGKRAGNRRIFLDPGRVGGRLAPAAHSGGGAGELRLRHTQEPDCVPAP